MMMIIKMAMCRKFVSKYLDTNDFSSEMNGSGVERNDFDDFGGPQHGKLTVMPWNELNELMSRSMKSLNISAMIFT